MNSHGVSKISQKVFLKLLLKAKFKFNFRSFEKLKILVVRFGHVGRGQKSSRKVFLGVSSPSGRSQLNIFCVPPPFIGVPASRHLSIFCRISGQNFQKNIIYVGFLPSFQTFSVFRLCMVQEMPYIGTTPKGKIPYTLTLLKYPNTKTSLYKLSKNHWVIALFKFFGSVRKKLHVTVSFDHPVV